MPQKHRQLGAWRSAYASCEARSAFGHRSSAGIEPNVPAPEHDHTSAPRESALSAPAAARPHRGRRTVAARIPNSLGQALQVGRPSSPAARSSEAASTALGKVGRPQAATLPTLLLQRNTPAEDGRVGAAPGRSRQPRCIARSARDRRGLPRRHPRRVLGSDEELAWRPRPASRV